MRRPTRCRSTALIASRFNDDGVTALYQAIATALRGHGLALADGALAHPASKHSTQQQAVVPPARVRYLAEIAETVRGYHANAIAQSRLARERQQLRAAKGMLAADAACARARRARRRPGC